MSARRIQLFTPTSQFVRRFRSQLRLEPPARERVQFRRVEQRLDECPDIQAGPSDDDGSLLKFARALDPFVCLVGPARGRVPLAGFGDIDAIVSDARALLVGWLGSADIEVTVDLARI